MDVQMFPDSSNALRVLGLHQLYIKFNFQHIASAQHVTNFDLVKFPYILIKASPVCDKSIFQCFLIYKTRTSATDRFLNNLLFYIVLKLFLNVLV